MSRYLATALAVVAALSAVPALAAGKDANLRKFPPAPKCAGGCTTNAGGVIALPMRYNWKTLHAIYKPRKNAEPFAKVMAGCSGRAQSIYETNSYLYGDGWGTVDAIDDARNCFARHGWSFLGWRQANGKITPYPSYDPRLDF